VADREREPPTPPYDREEKVKKQRRKKKKSEMAGAAGLGVKATPFTYAAHALAVTAAVLVLVWCVHFRGGLALEAPNKNLIFNVSAHEPHASATFSPRSSSQVAQASGMIGFPLSI
jgi:hypothetical protein